MKLPPYHSPRFSGRIIDRRDHDCNVLVGKEKRISWIWEWNWFRIFLGNSIPPFVSREYHAAKKVNALNDMAGTALPEHMEIVIENSSTPVRRRRLLREFEKAMSFSIRYQPPQDSPHSVEPKNLIHIGIRSRDYLAIPLKRFNQVLDQLFEIGKELQPDFEALVSGVRQQQSDWQPKKEQWENSLWELLSGKKAKS